MSFRESYVYSVSESKFKERFVIFFKLFKSSFVGFLVLLFVGGFLVLLLVDFSDGSFGGSSIGF